MQLDPRVLKILERFEAAGIEAYTVGGSVRDSLLCLTPFDFDITTKATPEEVMVLFNDVKIIETGIKHGTVTLVFEGLPVEVTTYRVDKGYSDGRHPDKVLFSNNLKEDLARRDFTINAICYCPRKGYFDPFGGRDDLENKIIRTVGDAATRFSEDSLRILRAMRFSSVLGLEIEEQTKNAIFSSAHLMSSLSKERIYSELKKIISGQNAVAVLTEFFPILHFAVESLGEYKNTLPKFYAPQQIHNDISLSFSAFFLSIEPDPQKALTLAEKTFNYLKSDKKTSGEVCKIIKAFSNGLPNTKSEIKWLLNSIGQDLSYKTVALFSALPQKEQTKLTSINKALDDIIKNNECYKISQLDITGNDILKLGVLPQNTGNILNKLLKAVIEEKCVNTKDSLITLALKEDF